MDLKNVRQEYHQKELNLEDLKIDPVEQIQDWFEYAKKKEIPYLNAATLATVNAKGIPTNRIILIKEIENDGITFFTDYTSKKAMDIYQNKNVSLLIFWKELDRQIRVNGQARKIDAIESEKYFYSRPRESQISALASNQSQPISKEELNRRVQELDLKYKDQPVDFPENWGGYKISFDEVEVWQGRPSRLHDRFLYTQEKSFWKITRLSP